MSRWTAEDLAAFEKRGGEWPRTGLKRPQGDAGALGSVSGSGATSQTIPGGSTRSKYGAVPTNGYASAKEAKRAGELKLLEKAGRIRELREQVVFVLLPDQPLFSERAVKYLADFVYEERDSLGRWHRIVEDTKGIRTSAYIIKRKLMAYMHNISVREV